MKIEVTLAPKKVGDKARKYKVDDVNVDTFLERGFTLTKEEQSKYNKYLKKEK